MGIVAEYPVGSRVAHSHYGPGTVMGHDMVDPLRPSSHRVGVVFDTHTLFAKPAYFFHDELTMLRRTFRVIKAPDDMSDDYEGEEVQP